MPDLNDFHAFNSTSSSSGGGGCSGNFFTWILVILGVLWIVGKLFG